MFYQSTRSEYRTDDVRAVLDGIAPDGGLFVDPSLGSKPFDWRSCLQLPPLEMAKSLLGFLLPGFEDMPSLVERAYNGKFDTPELTPLVAVGDFFALELFHGPTSAFKDVALSVLPQLISAARRQLGETGDTLILTATSGDTGKAALEGFHDVPGTRIAVFYPDGGVSAVQRKQMVTQRGENVAVCALRGNFDDCQRGVKKAFSELKDRSEMHLSSANSINIGRLAPQLVYYFIAYAELLKRRRIQAGDPVDFVVPTGNFGDILAGYMAKLLGLPVGKLVCASNANRVLTDFFETGVYDRRRDFQKTSSPSMDILVSSNLERLLFYVMDQKVEDVNACMEELERVGRYQLDETLMARLRKFFAAYSCDEDSCMETIGKIYRETDYVCDPHTAVGFFAAEQFRRESKSDAPVVVLSTASPYKFPGAVLKAIGGDLPADEFEQMAELQRLTGVPIPKNLATLRCAKELHRDVIGKEELSAYVLKLSGKEERL